jgi:hypothetical protein
VRPIILDTGCFVLFVVVVLLAVFVLVLVFLLLLLSAALLAGTYNRTQDSADPQQRTLLSTQV